LIQLFDSIQPSNVIIETLNVGTNFISGSISGEIGQLTHLKELDVSATEVYGSIPSEIGLLSSLRTLNAGVSKIKGSIPTELGNVNSSIVELRLHGLQLERAEIPSELGRCTFLGKSLNKIYVKVNVFLTGTQRNTVA
jgi:Leucine-rich repeat (LRR) protein